MVWLLSWKQEQATESQGKLEVVGTIQERWRHADNAEDLEGSEEICWYLGDKISDVYRPIRYGFWETGTEFFFFSGFISRWWIWRYNAEPVRVNLGLSKFEVIEEYESMCMNTELCREVETDDKTLRARNI